MENKTPLPENNSSPDKRPTLNVNIWFLPLAFAIGLLVGFAFWGRSTTQNSAVSADTAGLGAQGSTPEATQQIKRYPVTVDDDPTLGSANAPITVIEFSDFQCPYCQKWEQEVYGQLLQDYGDKIRFVYRDFPLTSIHPQAQPAAEAAECANEQGAFWKYHDKLFGMESPLGADTYVKYASELGLDMTKFQQCLTDHRYQAEVTADLEYATNLGINSTPTFFINGIPVVGAQPYSVFKYVIDKELAGELPK
ncbi:MAG: oxidoreductase family protein [Chloroflexi bacterium]|nr:oxidoreductase family protein [Chloroflexota bacterium]